MGERNTEVTDRFKIRCLTDGIELKVTKYTDYLLTTLPDGSTEKRVGQSEIITENGAMVYERDGHYLMISAAGEIWAERVE